MENKTRKVISLWGKHYAIYVSNKNIKLFSTSDRDDPASETSSIMWMIWPGSEVAEILSSGSEKMLGIINTDCLLYANKETSGMKCGNSFQFETISAKKVEAVFEFLRSDAYLFSLS